MKTIQEITSGYDEEWIVGACRELYHFNRIGLWPAHRPCINDLSHQLELAGYPSNQIQNICIMFVQMTAVAMLPELSHELKEAKEKCKSL